MTIGKPARQLKPEVSRPGKKAGGSRSEAMPQLG